MLPILVLGLDSPTHSLVDKALRCLSTILKVLDFSTIKNELFPVVAAVFSRTSSLAIKIRGLEAFVILCGGTNESETIEDESSGLKSQILDKYTVQEKIVPLMRVIKTKEPAVMMAALKVFKQIGKIADADFLATDVLPILWSFALGPLLSMQQFQQFMDLIKTTSSRIESEHTRKLRALAVESGNTAESNTASTNDLMSLPNDGPFSPSSSNVGEDDFARLVLGRSSGATSNATQSQTSSVFTSQSTTSTPAFSPPAQPAKPLHDFGWSSQPLQPGSSSSRAITPDHAAQSISSFPVMSPANNNMGGRPPLQSTGSTSSIPSAFGNPQSNQWSSNAPQQPQQSVSNYNAWSSTSPPAPQSSGWSLPPPPGSSGSFGGQMNGMGRGMGMSGSSGMTNWNSMGGNNTSGINNMGGNTSTGMGMGIGGMNGMANKPMQQQSTTWGQAPLQPQGQQQKPQGQKSGLDKYESLI
jgi:SCY1-like protein 2